MSYNAKLEEKIEATVASLTRSLSPKKRREGLVDKDISIRWQNAQKKKMFGGVCWFLKGNMAFGIWKDFLIVRMDKNQAEQSLKDKNTKVFDITGRPMAGWVMVNEKGWKSQAALEKWMGIGKQYAISLPEKKEKAKKTKTLREYRACDSESVKPKIWKCQF